MLVVIVAFLMIVTPIPDRVVAVIQFLRRVLTLKHAGQGAQPHDLAGIRRHPVKLPAGSSFWRPVSSFW